MASGFSQKMAFPASAAIFVTAPCVSVGVTMTTASMEGSVMTCAGSVEPTGMSNSLTTSSTAVRERSATAASRVQGMRAARSRAYTRPSRPSPINATFNFAAPVLCATPISLRGNEIAASEALR